MSTKKLEALVAKHFNFLTEEHGFVVDGLGLNYRKGDLSIGIQHFQGELNILFTVQGTQFRLFYFPNVLTQVMNEQFVYPDKFLSLVISMGDVESRLAFDAKMMKEYCQEILEKGSPALL